MRARLVLLTLVAIVSAAIRAEGPPRVPVDDVRPGPAVPDAQPSPTLANIPISEGDLIVSGDYSFGGLGGCRHEVGYRFEDGSLVKGSLGRSPGACSVTYEWFVWYSEGTHYSAILWMDRGARGEWNLGHGFAARCDFLALSRCLRVGIDWYPLWDRVQLSCGIDLWRGGTYFNWALALT